MQLADVFASVAGAQSHVEIRAFDGSRAGDPGAGVSLELKSPRGVSLLLSSPGQLGLARAYVAGELEVHGDMYDTLNALTDLNINHLDRRTKLRIARALAPFAAKGRVTPPAEEIRLRGRQHGMPRDVDAISHHYDVSNRFYEWVLGPSMAYTCAVYDTEQTSLQQGQEEKFDLICRKLNLQPGQRLLDVGCGWGGMVLHAVKNYGVTAIGVTLSGQQAEYGQRQISDAGLGGHASIRHSDYRSVSESGFDAVSSIGLTEHIGRSNYRTYFDFLRSRVRPAGRLLNHCITRTDTSSPTIFRGSFINRYVFPDGELVPISRIMSVAEDSGLEIRHAENLREHYVLTLRDWSANLDLHWSDAVDEVGVGKARVWRLYLAASRLAFGRNLIQLHQALFVNTSDSGDAAFPLRIDFTANSSTC